MRAEVFDLGPVTSPGAEFLDRAVGRDVGGEVEGGEVEHGCLALTGLAHSFLSPESESESGGVHDGCAVQEDEDPHS